MQDVVQDERQSQALLLKVCIEISSHLYLLCSYT